MFALWISIFLFFLLAEMGVPGSFFYLSISCGALVGLLSDLLAVSFKTEVISFLIATIIGFYCLRQIASRIQAKGQTKIGIERLKGAITIMTSEATNLPGTVHIAGTTWNAQSAHHERIYVGELVRIIDIKGTLLIVEPVKK